MKKYLLILISFLLCLSCAEKELEQPGIGIKDGFLEIDFSHKAFKDIHFSTKATLPSIAEARIINLTVILFDTEGHKVATVPFTRANRAATIDDFYNSEAISWFANEYDPELGMYTNGKCKAPISTAISQGRIYVLANLEDDMFTISQNAVSSIGAFNTENELRDFVFSYIGGLESSSRMGNFLMLGWADVSRESAESSDLVYSGGTWTGSQSGTGHVLMLERVDAKVSVTIGVIPGAVTERTENGQIVREEIESFTPTNWQVCRLPKKSKLFESNNPYTSLNPNDYFDTPIYYFETSNADAPCQGYVNGVLTNTTRTEHGFSFYMLENCQDISQDGRSVYDPAAQTEYGISAYHLRDKRRKNAEGTENEGAYSSGDDMWEFAPENATYLKIRGRVRMKYNDQIVANSQTLEADVTYYVHLGSFVSSEITGESLFDNYSVNRNTHYNYNINIAGVNSIQVEVLQDVEEYAASNEIQPGATGLVSVTQEEIYTFDSHFGQRVYKFHAPSILDTYEINNLTFYVSTPFGRAGSPDWIDENIIPNGIDYKWVHFYRNSKEASYVEPHGAIDGGPLTVTNAQYPNYCTNNRIWPGLNAQLPQDPNGEGLMDVIQFCTYLRSQLRKYSNGQPNDFDENGYIYVTAFVDEFYYETSPISDRPLYHWSTFVNKPMRTMHILCDSKFSKDGDSAQTGSAITIQQRSLQTIFTSTAAEGWASETEDETRAGLWFFSTTETRNATVQTSTFPATTNNNGFYNSAVLWDLLNADGSFKEGVPWSQYLDYIRPNNYAPTSTHPDVNISFLRDDPDYATMRYACLSRNRDENGDGIIDQDEIKWYMASLEQLQFLFIGDLGLESNAQLYYVDEMSNSRTGWASGNDYWKWRCHVACSTIPSNNGLPYIVWAEEGCSISAYGMDNKWNKPAAYSVRCARNLDRILVSNGNETITRPKDITDRFDVPESPITMTQNELDGNYTFDLTKLNSLSKRIKTTEELVPMDENSVSARPYDIFTTGDTSPVTLQMKNYPTFRSNLMRGVANTSGCPEGYRVPNVREMTIMFLLIPKNAPFWGPTALNYLTCNYYSFGAESSTNFDNQSAAVYSWAFNPKNQHISLDAGTTCSIRCVKDGGG